jgi:hypothetical protein
MLIYIGAVLVANYTATWFFPLPVFGMVSVGTWSLASPSPSAIAFIDTAVKRST